LAQKLQVPEKLIVVPSSEHVLGCSLSVKKKKKLKKKMMMMRANIWFYCVLGLQISPGNLQLYLKGKRILGWPTQDQMGSLPRGRAL